MSCTTSISPILLIVCKISGSNFATRYLFPFLNVGTELFPTPSLYGSSVTRYLPGLAAHPSSPWQHSAAESAARGHGSSVAFQPAPAAALAATCRRYATRKRWRDCASRSPLAAMHTYATCSAAMNYLTTTRRAECPMSLDTAQAGQPTENGSEADS